MASWALGHAPWWSIARNRLRPDIGSSYSRAWTLSKTYFSSPILSDETPASKALKAHPYPSTPVDDAIFEEETEEYPVAAAVAQPVTAHSPTEVRRVCHVLRRMVKLGDFGDAERVRADITKIGVPIQPDEAYDIAALYIASTPTYPNRVEAFAAWFSLTPDKNSRRKQPRLEDMCARLLRGPSRRDLSPDLSLVIPFALISASKGYASIVGVEALLLITRYLDPKISIPFLHQLIKVSKEYDAKARVRGSLMSQFFYDAAITTQCSVGRENEAFSLLSGALADGVKVSKGTFRTMAGKLAEKGDVKRLDLVANMGQQQYPHAINAATLASDAQAKAQNTVVRQRQYDATWKSANPAMTPNALAKQLLAAKRALIHPTPVPIGAITSAIQSFVTIDRSRPLALLRRRAIQHSPSAFSRWVLAQMLFHRQRGEHELLVLTFLRNCYVVGVPRAPFDRVLAERTRLNKGSAPFVKGIRLPDALYRYPQPDRKAAPSPAHTALVWEAAVRFAEDTPQLEALYEELLAAVAATNGVAPLRQNATRAPASLFGIVPPPAQRFDAAHFMPFVFRFATRFSADAAARVVADMDALHVPPSLHIANVVIGALARQGSAGRVWGLLDELESGARGNDLRPDVVTYTTVIRGFLDYGRAAHARRAVARMRERLGYEMGKNDRTDAVLGMVAERRSRNPENVRLAELLPNVA